MTAGFGLRAPLPPRWGIPGDLAEFGFKDWREVRFDEFVFKGVYVVIDGEGQVLYVGMSGNILARIREHHEIPGAYRVLFVETNYSPKDLEEAMIGALRPPHNRDIPKDVVSAEEVRRAYNYSTRP